MEVLVVVIVVVVRWYVGKQCMDFTITTDEVVMT